ncbi:MAG: TspO/MBR family protein [Alphaproteobacteria bacterium]
MTFVAALVGAQFGPDGWYAGLAKPSWTPPGWLFAPVWTVLYLLIATAGWLVWRAARAMAVFPVILWAVQIMLNGAWSWLFFGLERPGLALLDIAGLMVAIVAFIVAARRFSPAAAWLFLPYALWVGFAAALNFEIWRLNS